MSSAWRVIWRQVRRNSTNMAASGPQRDALGVASLSKHIPPTDNMPAQESLRCAWSGLCVLDKQPIRRQDVINCECASESPAVMSLTIPIGWVFGFVCFLFSSWRNPLLSNEHCPFVQVNALTRICLYGTVRTMCLYTCTHSVSIHIYTHCVYTHM